MTLQGRDPFSGDCDSSSLTSRILGVIPALQGRDPFSGDCDTGPRWEAKTARSSLAGTRPVFRGLRLERLRACLQQIESAACRDETRFQGIATGRSRDRDNTPVSALQGRDPFSGDCDRAAASMEARSRTSALQGRDPFSGDCDILTSCREMISATSNLQGRDPFLGDCDGEKGLAMKPTG